MAKDFDRAHSTISDFENGRRLPGVEVVEQYEDYFGLVRGTLGAQRERARAERLESPLDATVEENLGDVVCPYVGLRSFERADAALFFGRETQVDDVLARLKETRFVAVLGASGSGKSSFVRAGLLAGIRTQASDGGPSARVVVLTPGEHPLAVLTAAFQVATPVTSDELRADPDRPGRAARDAGDGALVIVVDQLEELFTLCADESERRRFVEVLIAAWCDSSSRVVVIVALRADFYGRVADYPELAAAFVAHQTLIGPMSPAELRRAIELPAAGCGLLLQPGLTDTMLEDLVGEPGALPLLSHALLETWKRRRRLMLSLGGYREAGGVRGAIAQTAEHTLLSLSDADQQIARSIFLSLTDLGDSAEPTRRRVDRADLAASVEPAQRDRILAVLADARLLTLDETTVTVAHEALIRHWPRLCGWIETDRADLLTHRRLTAAAREWHTLQRETGALYRGARLTAARDWAADHADQLSALERDFLLASDRSEHRELEDAKRRTRRLRALSGGLAGLTTITAVLAVWALDQRAGAQREARRATSLVLASTAVELLKSRPDVAVLVAFEGYRASPRVEARSSLLAALSSARDPGVLAILHGHTDAVTGVAFSRDGRTLASSSADGALQLWDTRSHAPRGAPLKSQRALYSVAFSPDGRTVLSGGGDTTLRLWDIASREQRGKPLNDHHGPVRSVAVSRDGQMLATGSADRTIRLWDRRRHAPRGVPLRGHTDTVASVAFSPDGRTLASASTDNTIRLWDIGSHAPRGVPLRGHNGAVANVAFSRDGHTLASASTDNTIRLWDIGSHAPRGVPLRGHNGAVTSVAFSRDGHTLASASTDNTIRLWDTRSRRRQPLNEHTRAVTDLAFSPDGQTVASASADATIRLWDPRSRAPRGEPLRGHTGAVTSVAYSPDGHTLASASADRTIQLWGIRSRAPRGVPLRGHTGAVTSVAFSPDGRTLASASTDTTIQLWDIRTHTRRGQPLRGHKNTVTRLVFSHDGHTLASASTDTTVLFWDARSRALRRAPLIAASPLHGVSFSPDGRTLASGSSDSTIWLWNLSGITSGGQRLDEHAGPVTDVAFSPDGQTLASAGADRTIRLWDAPTRKLLVSLRGHTDAVRALTFSPDGRTLASSGDDKTIHLWEKILWRTFAQLRAQVCDLVGTGLSRAEWARYTAGISYRQSCP